MGDNIESGELDAAKVAAQASAAANRPATDSAAPKVAGVTFVPDVRQAFQWAETKIAMVAVGVLGVVPTLVAHWAAAPDSIRDTVTHWLPEGAAKNVAVAFFVLQALATTIDFKTTFGKKSGDPS